MQFIKDELKRFLADKVKISPEDLDDNTEIYTSGLFTSLTVVELIAHIESNFSFEVYPSDLTMENFNDIQSVSKYIEHRINEGAAL